MTDRYGEIPISIGKEESKRSSSPKSAKRTKKKTSTKIPRPRKKISKYWLIPLLTFLVFAGYYVLSSIFLPILIQQKLPALFQQKTGLELSINSAKFNPLNFSFLLGSVSIDSIDKDGTTDDLLKVKELFLDVNFPSLLRNGFVTERLTIKDATLSILRHPDQTYNISPFFSKESTQASDTLNLADLPFLYSLNNITISDSTINFHDLNTKKIHNIENLSVNLPTLSNFSYDAGQYIQPRFSAVVNGSPIELVGETKKEMIDGQDRETTTLTCTLQSFNLPLYANFLPISLPVNILKGSADGTLQISFSSEKSLGRQLTVDYQLSAKNVAVESHDKTALLATPSLILEGSIKPLNSFVKIKKMLVKEPQVKLAQSLSAATIDSLLLKTSKRDLIEELAQPKPAISIDLLIADNGKIILESEKDKQIYNQIQLSIKNFANARILQGKKAATESSFSFSGQSEIDSFEFYWNGKFKNDLPSGKLEVKNISLNKIISTFSPAKKTAATGNASIRGNLTISRSDKTPFNIKFDQGSLHFSKYSFAEDNMKWLAGEKGKISPISISEKVVSLGNIFLEKTTITLKQEKLPTLLNDLISAEKLRIKGLDIVGELRLLHKNNKDAELNFSDIKLQLKDFDNKGKNDNFIFTAAFGEAGSIKAKGKVSLNPVQGIIGIALNAIPANSLILRLPLSGYQPDASTFISGIGNYNLEKQLFNGALEIDNGVFNNKQKKRQIKFSKGVIGKLDFSAAANLLEISNSVFKNIEFNSEDLNITADGFTLDSLRNKNNNISIGAASLPQAAIKLNDFSPEVSADLFKVRKGKFSLNKLHLDGKITLVQQNKEDQIIADNFELDISALGSPKEKDKNLSIKARLTDQAAVSATGSLSIFPVKTQLDFTFSDVNSSILNRYFKRIQNLNLMSSFSGNISYQYPEKSYSGKVNLGSGTIGNKKNFSLKWDKAQIDALTIADLPYRIEISNLTLDNPQTHLTTKQEHFLTALSQEIKSLVAVEVPLGETAINPQVFIDKIVIRNGKVGLTDGRLSPPLKSEITSLDGNIRKFKLRKSKEPIDFAIKGDISDSSFSYEGRFIHAQENPQETFSLQHAFVPLDLYKTQLARSFDIETQNALIDLKYQKSEQTTPAIASFDISLLKAKPNASATDLALALLENNKKKVSATLFFQSSDKHLFTYLNNHFQKLLIKGAVSPYLLLDSPYNKLRELDTFTFEPGDTTLHSEIKEKLNSFSNLIKDHPRVKLLIKASIARAIEKPVLQKQLEKRELEKVKNQNSQLQQDAQKNQIQQPSPSSTTTNTPTDEITEEELELFTPLSAEPVVVDNAKLTQLAQLRLKAMRDYLVNINSVPPQNIELDSQITINDDLQTSIIRLTLGSIPSHSPNLQKGQTE